MIKNVLGIFNKPCKKIGSILRHEIYHCYHNRSQEHLRELWVQFKHNLVLLINDFVCGTLRLDIELFSDSILMKLFDVVSLGVQFESCSELDNGLHGWLYWWKPGWATINLNTESDQSEAAYNPRYVNIVSKFCLVWMMSIRNTSSNRRRIDETDSKRIPMYELLFLAYYILQINSVNIFRQNFTRLLSNDYLGQHTYEILNTF